MPYAWFPNEVLFSTSFVSKYGIVILNREIDLPCDMLLNLWNNACERVTVDGGTNRWLSYLKLHSYDIESVKFPTLITGDMDSIDKDAMAFFTKQSQVEIVETPDQNNTDFTKALLEISNRHFNLDYIIAVCLTSGRLDHIFSQMNTLYKACDILPMTNVYILSSNSLTWLLNIGDHRIHIPYELQNKDEWCGLIPLGNPCTSVTTTGLKWNLNNSQMEFGGMVSTSNTYNGEDCVTVKNNEILIWTMGVKSLL